MFGHHKTMYLRPPYRVDEFPIPTSYCSLEIFHFTPLSDCPHLESTSLNQRNGDLNHQPNVPKEKNLYRFCKLSLLLLRVINQFLSYKKMMLPLSLLICCKNFCNPKRKISNLSQVLGINFHRVQCWYSGSPRVLMKNVFLWLFRTRASLLTLSHPSSILTFSWMSPRRTVDCCLSSESRIRSALCICNPEPRACRANATQTVSLILLICWLYDPKNCLKGHIFQRARH